MEPFNNNAAIEILAQLSQEIPEDDTEKQAALSRAVMALNVATDRAVDVMTMNFIEYAKQMEAQQNGGS